MSADSPIVLVVGAASRDVVADDPRGWRLGGAVLYASLALARLGCQVWAVVGADRDASTADELEVVREAGVTMAIAQLASGPVFDNVRHLYLEPSDPVPLTALPRRWTSGFDGLLLAPVAAEVAEEWASLAGGSPRPLVGLGWQGCLRVLEPGTVIVPRPPAASAITRAARRSARSDSSITGSTTYAWAPEAQAAWTNSKTRSRCFGPRRVVRMVPRPGGFCRSTEMSRSP